MALPNLSGSYIQDTYQRVLHTDGTNIVDGTGSVILASTELSSLQTMNNNTISNADWTYVESMDQHVNTTGPVQFTHITSSGEISASRKIYAEQFLVDGKLAIDYTVGSVIVYGQNDTSCRLRGDTIKLGEDATQHVTASGNISASGDIYGADRYLKDLNSLVWDSGANNQTVIGHAANHNLGIYSGSTKTINLDVASGHITASGDISSSGIVYGDSGSFQHLTAIRSSHNSTVGGSSVLQISDAQAAGEAVGNKAEINFYTNQDSIATNLVHAGIGIDKTSTSGNEIADLYFHVSSIGGTATERMRIKSDGNISASGNFTINEITASGHISASGYIQASEFRGDGASSTGLEVDGYIWASGSAGHITASGHISASGGVYAIRYFVDGANINTIYSPVAGHSSIATVGTIGTGVWQGTKVASAYLDDDTAHLTTDQTFTGNKTFSTSITASGDISSSKHLYCNSAFIDGQMTINSQQILAPAVSNTELAIGYATEWTSITYGRGVTTAHSFTGNVTASHYLQAIKDISGSATIYGDNVHIGNHNLSATYRLDVGAVHEACSQRIYSDYGNAGLIIRANDAANSQIQFYEESTKQFIIGAQGSSDKFIISTGSTIANGALLEITKVDGLISINTPLTASSNISSSAKITAKNYEYTLSGTTTVGDSNGDIIYFGTATSTTAGLIYFYNTDGGWTLADADTIGTAKGLLAVALDDNSSKGMLLKGVTTLHTITGTQNEGIPLYLKAGADGHANIDDPTNGGDAVRIIGYCLNTAKLVWFDPDKTWVEVAS